MEDSSNISDFEMVDKISSVTVSSANPAGISMITNIPPPVELPSFITSPSIAPTLDSQEPSHAGTQLSQAPVLPSTLIDNAGKTQSLPVTPSTSVPVTIQPLPPSSSSSSMPSTSAQTHLQKNATEENSSPPGDGWMGWIKGTVQSVGYKVAEKAKTSMDTMITTLDPQMREFINSGGDVDLIVASDKEVKVSPVKEAFQKVFGKATVTGFPSQCSGVAAQPVGFHAATISAGERIQNLRKSGKVHPEHPVVAVENFIVELRNKYWVEMGLLLLDDPWFKITLSTYTQPIPVPETFILELKNSTPDDYPFKETGFQKTVGQVAAAHLQVHHSMWQETLTGIPRRDYILMSAKVLAELYRSRLPNDAI